MFKKMGSFTRATIRKVTTKTGAVKRVAVKQHYNKLNRKLGRKK